MGRTDLQDISIQVAVLSDQFRRAERHMQELDTKLDDVVERLAQQEVRLQTSTTNNSKYLGWVVAGLFMLIEGLLQFVVK